MKEGSEIECICLWKLCEGNVEEGLLYWEL
jgi:hypothetical protein